MTVVESKQNTPIPILFWLGLPVLWGIFQAVIELTLSQETLTKIHSEYGPHELLQFVFVASCAAIAFRSLIGLDRARFPWLAAWLGLAGVCCFFISGEEISWGQTFAQWPTPQYWAELNNQHETNFHNTSTWLNQKPRILLEIGIVTGGLIIPFLRRFKPTWLPQRLGIIYPPSILAVTAIIYVIIQFISTFCKHVLHFTPFNRSNEVEELYLYYFLLLYMITLRYRLKNPLYCKIDA